MYMQENGVHKGGKCHLELRILTQVTNCCNGTKYLLTHTRYTEGQMDLADCGFYLLKRRFYDITS